MVRPSLTFRGALVAAVDDIHDAIGTLTDRCETLWDEAREAALHEGLIGEPRRVSTRKHPGDGCSMSPAYDCNCSVSRHSDQSYPMSLRDATSNNLHTATPSTTSSGDYDTKFKQPSQANGSYSMGSAGHEQSTASVEMTTTESSGIFGRQPQSNHSRNGLTTAESRGSPPPIPRRSLRRPSQATFSAVTTPTAMTGLPVQDLRQQPLLGPATSANSPRSTKPKKRPLANLNAKLHRTRARRALEGACRTTSEFLKDIAHHRSASDDSNSISSFGASLTFSSPPLLAESVREPSESVREGWSIYFDLSDDSDDGDEDRK